MHGKVRARHDRWVSSRSGSRITGSASPSPPSEGRRDWERVMPVDWSLPNGRLVACRGV